MLRKKPRGPSGDPKSTRAALVLAARRAFERVGFDDTNTNQIARDAGFAPQTFYRHFPDKLAIFVEVYERWVEEQIGQTLGSRTAKAAAAALIAQHRETRVLRRSLRLLAVTDTRVRAVRARARMQQLEWLRERFPKLRSRPDDQLVAGLLAVERFADAIAEGETDDLGLAQRKVELRLSQLIGELVG